MNDLNRFFKKEAEMNVKNEVIKALAGADGDYISGEALAESLGVSRNSIWKAVKSMKEEGYEIEAISSKGYRLSGSGSCLSKELILSNVKTEIPGRDVIILDETESTNSAAKELAASGAAHGTTVVADRQTSGKGRIGRSFVSPSGKGLYMSVIVRPTFGVENASMITSAAAVAAAIAVEKLCGKDVDIKWVNDLYMNGKKICGILTEASLGLEMQSLDYAVIGIGINVKSMAEDFDEELRSRASSVEDEAGIVIDRNELCAAVLDELENWLKTVEDRSFLSEYRKREYLTGKRITAEVEGKTIIGTAVDIDRNANLIVELSDGKIIKINAGEANLIRPKLRR